MYIYNSLSQKKEKLQTIEENKVKMYVCGPTLYDEIHIGNARPIIFFDVVYRSLKYLGFDVDYVSNITDIDDKIVNKAIELNSDEKTVVANNKIKFNSILEQLNVLKINHRPEVTDYIKEIITLIEELIEENYAYITENGDVAFRVNKLNDYGKISHQKIEDLVHGNRVEMDSSKENTADFILWKKVDKGITWEASFGTGRPGWHSECVVMIRELLGDKIDIHGGGIDLKFPHHENENAQNEALTGNDLANIWMHNGFVNINSEKMSKSLNNFITVQQMLDKYSSNVIRLLLLQNNYRQEINLSEDYINETIKLNTKIQHYIKSIENFDQIINDIDLNPSDFQNDNITKVIEDDFNTPNLITLLLENIKLENVKESMTIIYLLGLTKEEEIQIPDEIIKLADLRKEAKTNKDFQKADQYREEINKLGYNVLDTREGYEISKN